MKKLTLSLLALLAACGDASTGSFDASPVMPTGTASRTPIRTSSPAPRKARSSRGRPASGAVASGTSPPRAAWRRAR